MSNKKYILILSIINIFRSIFLVSQALASKLLIDAAINNTRVLFYALIFGGLIICNIVLSLLFLFIRNKFSLKIEVKMKEDIYNELLKKDVNEAKKFHSGEITNVYLNDIQNIKNGLCQTIPNVFLYASRFLLSLFALAYLDYKILFILLLFGLIVVISARIYSKILKKYHKMALENDGKLNAYMQESFENIKIVKALNAEKNLSSSLHDRIKENYSIKDKRNKLSIVGHGGLYVLMEICAAFVMIYGAFGIVQGFLTYGSLVGLLQVISYFETPLSMFSSLITNYNAYKVSENRIQELYNIKNECNQIEINDFDEIIFEHVDFSYDQNVILKDFSLSIKKYDTILLKGHSGCGKTTLFNLLLGFISPNKGTIKVKYNNKFYNIKECRNLFSYVAQENILFSGTIEENAKLFIENYQEDKFINSLKIACIYDEINQKPNKLKTILNERGNGLSLGQIQRILLAIALEKNNQILLLDEFTSALDKELEKNIVNNVSCINKTKIIITHRDINLPNAKTIFLGEEYD